MTTTRKPPVKPGMVYRTSYFANCSSNPTRLVSELVRCGKLQRLQGGLYLAPAASRWGELLPQADQLLNAWLKGRQGSDWVFTGSESWNALGLGATAVHAVRWVYNKRRSGLVELGGHKFFMRKIPFPAHPPAEWVVVDLFNHAKYAAVDTALLLTKLTEAVAEKRFDPALLLKMAKRFGRKTTQLFVASAVNKEDK
mgnify:FL=1